MLAWDMPEVSFLAVIVMLTTIEYHYAPSRGSPSATLDDSVVKGVCEKNLFKRSILEFTIIIYNSI